MAEDKLTPYFKNFFLPEYLSNFRAGLKEVNVLYFATADEAPRKITLNPFPFMTLYDLKVLLYQHFRKEISAHPSFQSLLVPLPELETNEGERRSVTKNISTDYMTFEYSWTKPETKEAYVVISPFQRMTGPVDTQFVTESGRKNNGFAIRSRMTLEDYVREIHAEETLTLHLFLYKDVIGGLRPELRNSEREWFGRVAPYFPELNINQSTTTLSPELMKRAQIFDAYVTLCNEKLGLLENILEGESVPLLPMVVAGCKFLRLVWKRPVEKEEPLETMFYKLQATHERPFLRILPVGEAPITKLKMDSAFKIPDVSDPRLLRIWKEERSPKPDEDFLFSKIVIRRTVGTQPALYGTLRVFENNSADFLVLPPKQLRLLDPRSDLSALGSLLTQGLQGTPFAESLPEIADATIICAVRLPLQAKLMTSDMLKRRLASFQPLFQEIPALPGDKPLLMLRYKAVSNYAVEDKIYSFLSLMITRTIAKGEAALPELVVALQKEFQFTETEAQTKVTNWLRSRNEVQLALPETKDYIMTYNIGVDIAIFGQQSYYTIHLYRVDSEIVFHRIITAIALLLSGKDSDFITSEEETAVSEDVANAVAVASPGALVEVNRAVQSLAQGPGAVDVESTHSNNSQGSANLGNDRYMRMMMGGPGDDEEEGGMGEGEVLNMGNLLENERQNNAANLNVSARVGENTRRVEAAAASSLVAREVAPEQPRVAPREEVKSEESEEEVTTGKKKSYQGWVKSQLQIADQRLFQYSTDVAGRKIKKYVTMCQATESRQPYVLNQEQFEVMRETYAAEPEVTFVVYPLEPGDPLPDAADEVYTLLKYGTNPLKQNYYLCCQFFCTKDYIMVREKDFYSTVDKQGKPKPGESAPGKKDNGSCPFCHGLEIKVLKTPKPKETVIQRRAKKGETQRHLYVSFLQGETQHPEEFYMPCCFKEDMPMYASDPRFEKVRPQEEEKEEESRTVVGVPTTSYQVTMYRAHKKYIVGPEKEFLKISEIDGPQVGLLPAVLDAYFGQSPKEYVSREANKMELLPNANCFLRVGVENRSSYRYDSFFAALAPYLNFRNDAESVKERLREVFEQSGFGPRIFSFLNYGNLVLEFYNPGDPNPGEAELVSWVSTELGVDYNGTNKDAAQRLWKSYNRFLAFLESDKAKFDIDFSTKDKTKEYRQFAQMFALPGIITARGLILIVLELNDKNELTVRCPPFGYNVDQYSSSDFAFILHRSSGIWEPIFYSSNRAQTARFPARHQPEITFQRSVEAGWPSVVKQRVVEFTQQCRGLGRGAYTSTRMINPMVLIPMSVAIQSMPHIKPTGVVRDAYNHISAITFRAKAGKRGLVTLPVIDDEFIPVSIPIHLDWDDYEPAPMDWIVKYYKQNFEQMFPLYDGYRIKRRIKCTSTEKFVALQLANGLYIPAAPAKDESIVEHLKVAYIEEMEWSMNREIYFGNPASPCRTGSEEEMKAVKAQRAKEQDFMKAKESDMQEIFEHLRLTFSNWFSSEEVSPDVRSQIKKIIDTDKIPVFEKRKRLEILLGPTILSWMDTETPKGEQEGSLLRVDCRLSTQPSCSRRCVWRQANSETVGRCYLHSPKQFSVGGRLVNGPLLLMRRLLEELLRFPERKQQLLRGTVTTLVALKEAVKIGQQYILPESSLAWQDLLRLDWVESGKEMKRYYEEMSRKESDEESKEERKEESTEKPVSEESSLLGTALPEALQELFGAEDPKTSKLYLLEAKIAETTPPLNPYLVPLGTSAAELGMEEESTVLDAKAVKRFALLTRRPILYIDMVSDPPDVLAYSPARRLKTPVPYILVSTEGGPRVVSASKTMMLDVKPEALPGPLYDLYDNRIVLSD